MVQSGLEGLHDLVILWIFLIVGVVTIVTLGVMRAPISTLFPDSRVLEQTWTFLPIIILIRIAIPRIHLLCLQDFSCQEPLSTIKVIGNQWN